MPFANIGEADGPKGERHGWREYQIAWSDFGQPQAGPERSEG